MSINKHLFTLLQKSGLSENEIKFYMYVLDNEGCSVADIYKNTGVSKSAGYRVFEKLKDLGLLESDVASWQTEVKALPLTGLIRKLENQQRNKRRLITELKILNTARNISANSKIPGIETFEGNEVYEKYHELAQMKFDTNLVFGNWEPFNNRGSIVPIEKQFIKNRLQNGGNSLVLLTGTGPCSNEITDYDAQENRISKLVNSKYQNPVWINAFEGNNLVYIWTLDEAGKTHATLIDSAPVAQFYRNFIYSHAN